MTNFNQLESLAGQFRAPLYEVSFTEVLSYTTDGSGNRVPNETRVTVIPCRLKPVSTRAQAEVLFPGTTPTQTLLDGWVSVSDPSQTPLFPQFIRSQQLPKGAVKYNGRQGTLDISIPGVTQASAISGERFTARFTPS